ncbi:MAG: hypothetical protein K0S33_684 [Bacteroidetes bacterium]|nr:hypothetical protein [Bacteroidota bacterium]
MVDKSGRFEFNWEAESKKEVYKLQLEVTGEILGLMAIEDIPQEIRIDINALEASKDNVGPQKNYEGIAGCLIAFACRLASLNGYGGFVSLTPKTVLKKHYTEVYGFEPMGTKVCTYDENSEILIEKYLGGTII